MTDLQHYTEAEVEESLGAALAIVERLDPPEDLRQMAFDKAANMLAAKTIMPVQPFMQPGGVPLL